MSDFQSTATDVQKGYAILIFILICICTLVGVVFLLCFLNYEFSVWSSSMKGKSELAHAEFNRKIVITEAKAKEEAAKSLSNADIIRAEGVAQANKIIGDSLTNNEKYLEWKFIDELPQQQNQIIYLPTNSFLPVLEAGRALQLTERLNNDR